MVETFAWDLQRAPLKHRLKEVFKEKIWVLPRSG
jgi:hypothetical protein